MMNSELVEIVKRYDRRKLADKLPWDPLLPYNFMFSHEKRKALRDWITSTGLAPLHNKRLLEVGCGQAEDLLLMIGLGFRPENIVANDLIEDRAQELRHMLPGAARVISRDASELDFDDESFDVVYQSLVFSSVLDDEFRRKLAKKIWALTKKGGGVLWYDVVYNNFRNPDLKAVPFSTVRKLFPAGDMKVWRVTLAPPIGRLVTRMSPSLYTLFNVFPFLRTHILCWIVKTY